MMMQKVRINLQKLYFSAIIDWSTLTRHVLLEFKKLKVSCKDFWEEDLTFKIKLHSDWSYDTSRYLTN